MIARDHPLADRILGLVPINGLDARLQDQALAQGELLEFKRKKTVFEAGARDPYTFYLLEGELDLQAESASPVRMQAGDENARRALAQLQPRRYTAVTISNVVVFRIERAVLDHILADEQTLEESDNEMDVREIDDDEEDGTDWMTRLLSSALFMRLPHDNIQRFFTELEPQEVSESEVVVEQGTPGDYLYIVAEGRCAVVRRAPGGGQEVQLAVLKEGDTFGDEALISNSPRNATVRMLTDGMLMRLPKRAFEELVSNPTLKALPWSEATRLVEEGGQWLDVRFSDEHEANAIDGSLNVPLNVLRLQAGKLDTDTTYIVYCDTGARSSAGAFLLLRLGFDACYLAGGLARSPMPQDPPSTPETGPAIDAEDATDAAAAAAAAAFEFEYTTDTEPEQEAAAPASDEAQTAKPAPAPDAPQTPAPAVAPAAPPAPAPAAAAASAEMARARQILAQLKGERDRATEYGRKAADAARELKRRNDELANAIKEERTRREQLEKQLGAIRADTERAESMEQVRLKGELEKSGKRLDALQAEREAEQRKWSEELDKVRAESATSAERAKALLKEKEQVEEARVAAEVAFQDALREAGEKGERLGKDLAKLEQELAQTRERLTAAESQTQEADRDRLAETSELKIEVELARARVEEERQRFADERARHAEEVERITAEHEATRAALRGERAELDQAIAAQKARAEELDRREMDLTEARSTVDAELGEREAALSRREEGLAQGEEELSSEKASWKETVEKAIVEERERLEGDYSRFREEAEKDLEQRAAALAEEHMAERLDAHTEEMRAAHEAKETTMRTQVEAHVAKLLGEFDERLAKVRNGYEMRLNEQETLLEDERRRLETEIVRLREALADARGKASAPPPPPQAAPATGKEPALDFRMNEAAAAATDLEIDLPQPPRAPAAETPGPDLTLDVEPAATRKPPATPAAAAPDMELDLQIDEAALAPRAPAPESPSKMANEIPVIEMPADDEEEASEPAGPVKEKDQRVISSDQLADIRRRMQEKMRAAKSRAG